MTREEAIKLLVNATYSDEWQGNERLTTALNMAIEALNQKPCSNAIDRDEAIRVASGYCHFSNIPKELAKLPPVTVEPKMGRCKDCKYFEYDSVAKVDGIPLIVAHEICSKWGDGCKTREDGYCFLFESQESDRTCHTCKHYTSGEHDGSCGSYICKEYSNGESEDEK